MTFNTNKPRKATKLRRTTTTATTKARITAKVNRTNTTTTTKVRKNAEIPLTSLWDDANRTAMLRGLKETLPSNDWERCLAFRNELHRIGYPTVCQEKVDWHLAFFLYDKKENVNDVAATLAILMDFFKKVKQYAKSFENAMAVLRTCEFDFAKAANELWEQKVAPVKTPSGPLGQSSIKSFFGGATKMESKSARNAGVASNSPCEFDGRGFAAMPEPDLSAGEGKSIYRVVAIPHFTLLY
jgi:hypothetical protein